MTCAYVIDISYILDVDYKRGIKRKHFDAFGD